MNHIAPSVASVMSVANEMILGAVHRFPDICLLAEESPRKPQLGDRLMKGVMRPVIVSNWVPFLQMRSLGSHSTSGREKEGNKERTGWGLVFSTVNGSSVEGRTSAYTDAHHWNLNKA